MQPESGDRSDIDECVERELVELATHEVVETGPRQPEARGRILLREIPFLYPLADSQQQIGASSHVGRLRLSIRQSVEDAIEGLHIHCCAFQSLSHLWRVRYPAAPSAVFSSETHGARGFD